MNVPDGDDVGEEDDETEQISVPGSSKPLKHNTTSCYTLVGDSSTSSQLYMSRT